MLFNAKTHSRHADPLLYQQQRDCGVECSDLLET
jgi:hypothetical protein